MKKRLILLSSLFLLLGGVNLVSCANPGSSSQQVENSALEIKGDESVYVEGSTVLSVKSNGKNISATVTWSSSDESVATVNQNGKVSGISAGTAIITAVAEGYEEATFTITVKGNSQNITIYINPSFAEGSRDSEVAEGYAIFFGSSIDNWATSHQCTYEEGKGWAISFEDVEFDQTISYNTYYDKIGGSGWQFINNESEANASRALEVIEGTLTYEITSTFNIPNSLDSVKLKINAKMSDGSSLDDKVHLYVATSANAWTLTKATKVDGVWVLDDKNVPLGGSYGVTLALGSESSCDWTYKSSDVDGKYFTVNTDTTELVFDATFAAQPDLSAATYKITFELNCSDLPGSNLEVVVDPNSWNKSTWVEGTKYTVTIELTEGTHNFFFYSWNNVHYNLYADSSSTKFTINVTQDATVKYNISFTDMSATLITE